MERHELYTREEARKRLGLPNEGTAVLLNLSADTTDQLIHLMAHVASVLRRHTSADETLTVFAPRHALHAAALSGVDNVVMRPVYPVAKYANAFDAAISTTGYNSFHELVYLGVPTVFVARATGTLDDQNRRASFAPIAGFGLSAESVEGLDFEEAVKNVMDVRARNRMRIASRTAFPKNGANDAARVIEQLAVGGGPVRGMQEESAVHLTRTDVQADDEQTIASESTGRLRTKGNEVSVDRALEMMPSGIFLPKDAVHTSNRVLIDAVELADEDIPELVDKFVQMQLHYPYIKPVFLISALNPTELTRAGFIYETVLTESSWHALGIEAPYRDYTERRVHEMISVYRTSRFSAIQPRQEIPRWLYER